MPTNNQNQNQNNQNLDEEERERRSEQASEQPRDEQGRFEDEGGKAGRSQSGQGGQGGKGSAEKDERSQSGDRGDVRSRSPRAALVYNTKPMSGARRPDRQIANQIVNQDLPSLHVHGHTLAGTSQRPSPLLV